jgi:hypothetical protein
MHCTSTSHLLLSRIGALLLVLGPAAAACGGASVSTGNDGGQASMNEASATPCPATEPSPASACTMEGLQCEYGSDPSIACNKVYACTTGAWASVTSPFVAPCACPTQQATQTPGCPASFSALQANSACSTSGSTCLYPQGSFVCVTGGTCAPGVWALGTPGAAVPDCPATKPQLGTYCTSTARICDYSCGLGTSGGVSCGTACGISDAFVVRCDMTTGTWVEGQSDCAGC